MSRRLTALAVAAVLGAGGLAATAPRSLALAAPSDKVDPFVGTLGAGFTFPGPAAPYGMVQLSPDTEGQFAYTGYQWADQFIRGFSHVHVESMGVPEGGNLPFMPTVGPLVSTDVKRYQSHFSHATEMASPGYYKVLLDTYGVQAEVTAGTRVGMQRYRFPPTTQANVLLDVGREIAGGPSDDAQTTPGTYPATADVLPDHRTIVGTANPTRGGNFHYAVHFATRFSRPFSSAGGWTVRGAPATAGLTHIEGNGAGAYVTFDTTTASDVVVKTGISFVSQANALANLDSELPAGDFDFDALAARTKTRWDDALSSIRVEGGTAADQRSFYTALYHAQHHPNVFNDVNGDYMGHDGAAHRIGAPGDPMPTGSTYYANFSLWDTYRGEMQLLALVAPARYRDMMRSLAVIGTQGGRLPRWALMNTSPDYMVGEPVLPAIADGVCRGLVPADVLQTLYAGGLDVALGRPRDPTFISKGYVPYDVSGDGPSITLEDALTDFSLALVADRVGDTANRDRLLGVARNWANVFDPSIGFVRPRAADGSWKNPYFPEMSDNFKEGTGWQYTWLVPHDVAGLSARMGADTVGQRLDQFFAAAQVPVAGPEAQQKLSLYGIAYAGNQYAPSNEHDLQAPYLYDWLGQPSKTQALARNFQSLYRPTPDGIPGNDDLGSMSAWLVWADLGLYPAVGGAPVYLVGSPLFTGATVRVPGHRTLQIDAPGASATGKYVQSASLGGKPFGRTWLTHRDLLAKRSLRLDMGPASTTWGTGPGTAPPSLEGSPLSAFGCRP